MTLQNDLIKGDELLLFKNLFLFVEKVHFFRDFYKPENNIVVGFSFLSLSRSCKQ